jgi:hypothetical protein
MSEFRKSVFEKAREKNVKNIKNCTWISSLTPVLKELKKAKEKFPWWPTDPHRAFNIVAEEAGELVRELNMICDEPERSSVERAKKEAVQLAAMSIRFLENFKFYKCEKSRRC